MDVKGFLLVKTCKFNYFWVNLVYSLSFSEKKTFSLKLCKTENALCEAGVPTLSEMRELNTANVGIKKIQTNVSHPIRHIFCDTKIHDEYVLKTITPAPIFARTAEFLGKYNIDTRKIETTPTHSRAP
jgi:hypothetical protein